MDILDCAPSHVAPVGMATSVACPLGSELTLTHRSTSLPPRFSYTGKGVWQLPENCLPSKRMKELQ